MADLGLWLVKSEPYKYAFEQLLRDGRTMWDGVRNFEARNNLRSMKVGDLLLFYHSNEGKAVVGVARVVREAYPDPTSDEDWSVVDIEPVTPIACPVSLATIKATPELASMQLLRRSRLSVVPVTRAELSTILALGSTALDDDTTRPARPRKPASTAAAGKAPRKAPSKKALAARKKPGKAPTTKTAKAATTKAATTKTTRKKAGTTSASGARKRRG